MTDKVKNIKDINIMLSMLLTMILIWDLLGDEPTTGFKTVITKLQYMTTSDGHNQMAIDSM